MGQRSLGARSSAMSSPLLDLIGALESNGNYNAVYGQAGATEDLSQYTLDQIHDLQYRHGKLTGSSAFGKYQFLRKTLLGLREQLGLSGAEKFTPELQDELATALLIGRGLYRWESGVLSDSTFMDNLSKEWASLPYRNGRSYYDRDSMGNHALTSRSEVRAALDKQRKFA